MTEPTQSEVSDDLTIAYLRLKDLGLSLDAGDYSMNNLLKMKRAVEIVREFGRSLPEAVQAECQIKYFKSSQEIESFRDMFKASIIQQMQKQLLSEEEEQKRQKEARTKAIEEVRKKEQLDMIIDTEPPPEPGPKQPVPTREDLWNAMLQLQSQIKKLDDKLYTLENRKQ